MSRRPRIPASERLSLLAQSDLSLSDFAGDLPAFEGLSRQVKAPLEQVALERRREPAVAVEITEPCPQ